VTALVLALLAVGWAEAASPPARPLLRWLGFVALSVAAVVAL
jgi:hypothetical protein